MEREKIKNALSKSDLKTLLNIVKCYNKDNGLTPIYENSTDSIKELRDCGYTVDEIQIQDFAFLTPNRYGGVSGSNELGVDIETELVPYVEANYTTYAKDLHIDDATEFNLDWLKKNWKKTIGHTDRFANLVGIAEKVAREDDELSEKLLTIARKYDAEPKRYTYNWAKEEFFNIFRNNKKDPKPVVSEEDQNKMKVTAKETYEKFSGKKVDKYTNLPEDWQKALTPLIESERKEAFKFELKKLTGKEEDDDVKITEALKKDFEKIFGFEATEENIKKFGYKEEENGDEMLDCIKATFQAVKNKKIDYLIAVKFFEKVKTYPNKYLFFSEDWYEKPMTKEEKESSEAKKRQAERKSDLETESSDENIQKKKDEINEKASILKNSGNEEWINYWETDFQALKNMFKRGEYTEAEFYEELLDSLDYCLEKAGLKKSVNEKIEQEYQKNLSVIKNHDLYGYNDIRDAFEKFLDKLNYENKIKFVRLLSNALDKQELKFEDLSGMTEDEAYKFFEIFKKNKNAKQSLEQFKAQENEEKESE